MLGSELIDYRHVQLIRWIAAATFVAAIHATGGTLAMMQWAEEEYDPEPSGAVVMELAALAVAPTDPQDLALGPLVEEAVPTPVPTKEAFMEEVDLPQIEESLLAPNPEIVIPKVEKVETVKEIEETEIAQLQQVTEVNTASATPTAPPKVDALPDQTIKAQVAGVRIQPSPTEITWQRALLFHLNRHKRYPTEARSRHVQGVTKVEFKIDGTGKLVHAEIVKGSGSKLLDDEALAVLERASPFPAPPDRSPGETIHLALPIEFNIR